MYCLLWPQWTKHRRLSAQISCVDFTTTTRRNAPVVTQHDPICRAVLAQACAVCGRVRLTSSFGDECIRRNRYAPVYCFGFSASRRHCPDVSSQGQSPWTVRCGKIIQSHEAASWVAKYLRYFVCAKCQQRFEGDDRSRAWFYHGTIWLFRFRFRFGFIALVARKLKIKKLSKQVHCAIQ